MDDLIQKITDLVQPVLEPEQLDLVEVAVKGRPGGQLLKIFVDSAEGVKLDACTRVSRLISEHLDSAELFPQKYTLEVSSPGLNRPLKNYLDFKRNVNREVEIVYHEGEQSMQFSGQIASVSEKAVDIKSKKEVKSIPISKISYGKVSLPW